MDEGPHHVGRQIDARKGPQDMQRAPSETDTRIVFEPSYCAQNLGGFEEGAIFALNEAGGVTVNVSQEQAVDSNNQSFECTMSLSRKQAVDLLKWLTEQLT